MENKLTVVCWCYNQEKYIAEALDSFLAQKTDFPFGILVYDDASTDSSPQIIRDYAARHPGVIKAALRETNVGLWENMVGSLEEVVTPFVALCDGDDYWTDTAKLQKQMDFFKAHPECSVCFHAVKLKWEDGSHPDIVHPSAEQRFGKTMLTLDDLLRHNFILTNAVAYRWRFSRENSIRAAMPEGITTVDYLIHLLHAETGKIGYIDEVMAVYRRGIPSIWAASGVGSDAFYRRQGLGYLTLYRALHERYGRPCADEVRETARLTLRSQLVAHDWERLGEFSKRHPEALDNAIADLYSDKAIKKMKRKYKRIVAVLAVLLTVMLLLLLAVLFL